MNIEQLTVGHAMGMGPLMAVHSIAMTPDMAQALEQIGGWAVVDCGATIAIGGIVPRWPGVGLAWAWLGRDWRRHARAITAAAKEVLDASHLHRIEVGVQCGYAPGMRWVERLGFVLETPCAMAWGADGLDYAIWVRVKQWLH